VLDSLRRSGFRRILLVNGHGGNAPAGSLIQEWMADNPGTCVRFHNWYNAPRVWNKVQEIDPVASHASWMENFPWTRVPNARYPDEQKPMIHAERVRVLDPKKLRELLGDGNFGGFYQRSDDEMLAPSKVAVEETREMIEGPWA
jgi:creatinine amidohydrolase